MKILLYDAKPYDTESFNRERNSFPSLEIEYVEAGLSLHTVELSRGYDAVCVFVNCEVDGKLLAALSRCGVRLLLLRCAGFNNVDLAAAKKEQITVLRVPAYSPEAVAEHALALALIVARRIHKSYIKVRENNFSLVGLTGVNFFGKTAGIVGTGKIGAKMCALCHGLGMNVIAYDLYPNPELNYVTYVSLDELFSKSDLISLHCPATENNRHLVRAESIRKMKDGVILINTSRGALVNTEDLIRGIKDKKFFGVGLDVYEEEGANVFENREDDILEHCTSSRLLSFPNVVITSHQAFLTEEALSAIARVTLENAVAFERGESKESNRVV